jgi:hypothetical protein
MIPVLPFTGIIDDQFKELVFIGTFPESIKIGFVPNLKTPNSSPPPRLHPGTIPEGYSVRWR